MQSRHLHVTPHAGKPHVPLVFLRCIKDAVLGKRYDLSVAFVDSRTMRALNRRYRGRSSSTDVLSFALSPQSGEIVFSLRDVRAEAPRFGKTARTFLPFLFIHGLLHLKGYRHGGRMEHEEEKFRKRFRI